MPINRVLDKLDELAAANDNEGMERVLAYWENEARNLGDMKGLLAILSEAVGHYRHEGQEEKGLAAVYEALRLLEEDGTECTSNATIYLNCATTLKAFGRAEEALPYYERAKSVYERLLPADDFKLAGLYNNYAMALADLKRYEEAEQMLKRAIDILERKGGYAELAISYVNLAQIVYEGAAETGADREEETDKLLELAYSYLTNGEHERNAAYAGACMKCASAFDFFGYFAYRADVVKIANEIYEENRSKI